MNRREFYTAAFFVAAGARFRSVFAKQPDTEAIDTGPFNIRMPTLGAKQLWGDQWFFGEWRIQKHALTGHNRLLDPKDHRHAWGTFEQCRTKFDQIRTKSAIEPMRGSAVIVLHGLLRTRAAMANLSTMLRDRGRFNVVNFSYPTTRCTIADHASSLARVIKSLEEVDEINFVCHSMGNLVVRHWIHDMRARGGGDVTSRDHSLLGGKRVGRMVMLGPPNRQPEFAVALADVDLAAMLGGKALADLSARWNEIEPHLATPDFEFGVLAGGKGDETGYNPLVSGDDDMVVSVASTKLAGARDFRVLPVKHTFMKDDQRVQEYTLRFLKHGWFESDAKRVEIH